MDFTGEATVMGTSLELSGGQADDWGISIRRADGKSDPRFMACHGRPVTAADVAAFVPGWRTLTWRKIADSMFSHSKSQAEDSGYSITLSGARVSPLPHEAVVSAFEAFMASDSPQ